ANVVRSVAFGLPGLPVDTHVQRLSLRLGLTDQTDPVRVELVLNSMIPASQRGAFSLRLILHGRTTCKARSPRCEACVLSDFCPSALPPSERSGPSGRERILMGMVRVSNALPNHAWPAGDDPTPSVKHALRSRQRTRSAHGRARSELSPDAAKAP